MPVRVAETSHSLRALYLTFHGFKLSAVVTADNPEHDVASALAAA